LAIYVLVSPHNAAEPTRFVAPSRDCLAETLKTKSFKDETLKSQKIF